MESGLPQTVDLLIVTVDRGDKGRTRTDEQRMRSSGAFREQPIDADAL